MAELRLSSLSFQIEADGSAAIAEIDETAKAVENVEDAVKKTDETEQKYHQDSKGRWRDIHGRFVDLNTVLGKVGDGAGKAGEGIDGLGDNAEETGKAFGALGNSVKKLNIDLASVLENAEKIGTSMSKFVTAPLTGLYTVSVKGAADLVETIGKTEVVFGRFYERVEDWSESSITAMGIAQSTALDMASLYGDMATGMGFAQDSAANMAMELTRLAADMASFKNISIDVAQTALKSVFTGETESLKNLGVVMTQTNLQAYALSQGIEKNVQDMTQAEQVTLRYNYVLAQTANAQGDFERTGDSLSNQSRKLTQTLKQMGESYGTLLIPNVTNVVEKLQGAAQWMAELDDSTKNMILTIGLVAAATGPILAIGSKLIQTIQGIKTALTAASFGPTALAIAAAVAAAAGLVAAFRSTKKEVDETAESYQRVKRLLDKNLQTKVEVDSDELDGLEDKEINVTVKTTEEGPSENVKTFLKEVDELGWEAKDFTVTGSFEVSETTTEEIEAYAKALAEAATATGDYTAVVDALNAVLDDQYNARMQEINDQVLEEVENQVKLLNAGIIDEAEYEAQTRLILERAEAKKKELEAEKEAQQQANKVLEDGSRENDYAYTSEAMKEVYANSTLDTEDYKGAAAALQEAYNAGADMTEQTVNAQVALEGLKTASVENYNEMIAAKEAYDKAMQTADGTEAEAEAQEKRAENAKELAGWAMYLADYTLPFAENVDSAIDTALENMEVTGQEAETLKNQLMALFEGEDGQQIEFESYNELMQYVYDTSTALEQQAAAATEKAETLRTEAETQRNEATEAFGTSMSEIQNAVGLSEEGIEGLLEIIKSAGVSIDEADVQLIASVQAMVSGMATELEDGTPEVADKVSELIGAVGDKASEAAGEGKSVGAQITAGVEQGLKSGTGSLYRTARQIVENTIREFKVAAQIQSPSKRARDEIGKMFIRGVTVGVEDEMPSLLRKVTRGMDRVVSGAQSVVRVGTSSPSTAGSRESGLNFDRLRDVVKEAASEVKMSFSVGKRELATATVTETARAGNARQHDLNIGKVRT